MVHNHLPGASVWIPLTHKRGPVLHLESMTHPHGIRNDNAHVKLCLYLQSHRQMCSWCLYGRFQLAKKGTRDCSLTICFTVSITWEAIPCRRYSGRTPITWRCHPRSLVPGPNDFKTNASSIGDNWEGLECKMSKDNWHSYNIIPPILQLGTEHSLKGLPTFITLLFARSRRY